MFVIGGMLLLSPRFSFSQQSAHYTDIDAPLREAQQCIEQENYQQAWHLLQKYRQTDVTPSRDIYAAWAAYDLALCDLKLEKYEAEKKFRSLLQSTPFQSIRKIGSFALAQYYFQHALFEQAIRCYEETGIDYLSNVQLVTRNFELGYAYLVTQQLDKVDPYFKSARNIPGDYFTPGNYYHGLLSYYKKDYAAARASFNAVKNDEAYKHIIPFYLTEIEYLDGDKDKALETALSYLEAKDTLYYQKELNLMVAHMYLEREDYVQAESYYRRYLETVDSPSREDHFKLGWCLYKQDKWSEALSHLEIVNSDTDKLAQQTAWILAAVYDKQGDKKKLGILLSDMDTLSLNENQKQWLFNTQCKLSYESGNTENCKWLLTQYIHRYAAQTNDNDYTMLADLMMRTGDFVGATEAMKMINEIPQALLTTYQQSIYAKGITMLKENKIEEALMHFEEARKFPADESIPVLCDFWMAECHWRLNQFAEAMNASDRFLVANEAANYPAYLQQAHLVKTLLFRQNNDTANMIQQYLLVMHDTTAVDTLSVLALQKSDFIPDENPKVSDYKTDIQYNFSTPDLQIPYQPVPLRPLALQSTLKREDQTNYVQAKGGYMSTLDFRGAYNFDPYTPLPLYLEWQHQTQSDIRHQRQVGNHKLALSTHTSYKDHLIESKLNVEKNSWYYFGIRGNDFSEAAKFQKTSLRNFSMATHISPLSPHANHIQYAADVKTGIISSNQYCSELYAKALAPLSYSINESTRILANTRIDLNFYFNKNQSMQYNHLFAIEPALEKQLGKLHLHTGLYPTIGQNFSLLPDIRAEYPFPAAKLFLQAGWTSSVTLNTYQELTKQNPFLLNTYTPKQSVNTLYYAGAKGNILKNASYAVRGGFSVNQHLPFFMNDTVLSTHQFVTTYSQRALALLLDASAEYNLNMGWQAGANLTYRPLLEEQIRNQAWQYCPLKIEAYGRCMPIKNLSVQANLFILSGMRALVNSDVPPYAVTSKTGADLNLKGSYRFDKHWYFLMDIQNLLGTHYQPYYGYPVFGTQVLLGANYTFRNLPFTKQ